MSGPHAHALYVHGHSPIHRLAPECKLAAQLLFVIVVVATPREAFWAFGIYAVIAAVLTRVAELPAGFVLRRLAFEVPFVAFALLLPFFAGGERIEVLGIGVSVEGLWAMWNILAKATLGLAASIVVAGTITIAEFLRGFDRLHLPRAFTSTASFMIRYGDVIGDEMRRMRIARESRGHDPRWIWQARAVASSAGALFIRSYERGERVYLAMVSRGYTGAMPDLHERETTRVQWAAALSVPALAAIVASIAWTVRS